MQNKEINIREALEGEGKSVPHFNTYEKFKQEMMINNVESIFDNPRIEIKKDQERYLFAIDKQNKFTVAESNIERRIRQFCKEKETGDAKENFLIQIQKLGETTELKYIKATTQEELTELKSDIDKLKTSDARESNIDNIKYKLERNITALEREKEDAKSTSKDDKIDRILWKGYISQVQDRLDRLYRMKERVELIEKHDSEKYTIDRENVDGKKQIKEVYMSDINAFDKKETLKQINERIENIANEQKDFQDTRNSIINREEGTIPYYEIIINGKDDARKIRNMLKKTDKRYAVLDKIELDAAKKQELAQDLQDLEDYLNKVIDSPDTFKPSEHPFVPTHKEDFFKLVEKEPMLSNFLQLSRTKTKIPTTTKKEAMADVKKEENKETETTTGNKTGSNEYIPNNYASNKEAFAEKGINGAFKNRIDQTNMRPEQKQFRGGVGNLAITGGLVFIGRKMVSSAFKIVFKKGGAKEGKNRARLGIPTALIFASQARSGEGPTKLFTGGKLTEKISGLFGRGNGNNQESTTANGEKSSEATEETALKYKSFPGATALFNGLSYGEMKQFMKNDHGEMRIDPEKYDTLMNIFKSGDKKNEAAAAFLENIGKNDDKHIIDLALTGMGINRKDIEDESNKDKKFDKAAADAIVRLRSIMEYMEEKGYNRINPEMQHLVDDYVAHGKDIDDLEDLAKRGDVFYKETETVDRTGLKEKIRELTNGDEQKEEELLLAINTFYDTMPNASREIDISGTRENLTFTTYNQKVTLNLKNKELIGFTPSRFSSEYEMFKAANLTNRIKELCKNRIAKSDKPFTISTPGGDIEFNDANIFSTDFDTEMISAGMGGSLKEISPTLETYKQEYCDYLNGMHFRKKETPAK